MYAPRNQPSTSGRPLAAPPPPPRHVAFQGEQRQQSPPQPQPRPPATEEPDYLPMAMLGPSTSTLQSEGPTSNPARGTTSQQRHRPPPLTVILDRGYEVAAGAAGDQQPPTPLEEHPPNVLHEDGPINPMTGKPFWKARPFAAKRHPCVTSATNSPMDTSPPVESPPVLPDGHIISTTNSNVATTSTTGTASTTPSCGGSGQESGKDLQTLITH